MSQSKLPMIIWVVGDNTNVGKTTISAALIRVLNAMGVSAIGFKPYAGARLMDVIDLLQEIARGDGCLVGRDARQLAKASPLITPDLLEVVNPSWRLSHPVRDASVFVRKGSAQIGQREFWCAENSRTFWQRQDIRQLNEIIQLPITNMLATSHMEADKLDFNNQSVQKASFARLVSLKPQVVVCEGAGRLLPVWENAPTVKHIFLVSSGELHFFPDIRMQVGKTPDAFGPLTVGAIAKYLNGRKRVRASIPLAEQSRLEIVLDAFFRPFVAACIRS